MRLMFAPARVLAKDQMLFARAPTTHGPWIVNTTTPGPAPHLLLPRFLSVALGNKNVGPMPQMISPGFAGERNKRGVDVP